MTVRKGFIMHFVFQVLSFGKRKGLAWGGRGKWGRAIRWTTVSVFSESDDMTYSQSVGE